jgi:putative tricarboxylic transport membrane protein
MVMGSVMLGGIITGRPPVGLDKVRPLARLTNEYNVFVLPPNSPFRSMDEVLQQFRANPSSIKWGGGSRGSTEHIAIHMMARELGIDAKRINYVPFRGGGEAAAAIMGGYVTVGGSGYSEFLPHIAASRMLPVAVTSPKRLPGVDVPTLHELGVRLDIGNWRGVCAPPGLLDAQYELLDWMSAVVASDPWSRAIKRHGWLSEPLVGTAFADFLTREFDNMRSVLVRAGMA